MLKLRRWFSTSSRASSTTYRKNSPQSVRTSLSRAFLLPPLAQSGSVDRPDTCGAHGVLSFAELDRIRSGRERRRRSSRRASEASSRGFRRMDQVTISDAERSLEQGRSSVSGDRIGRAHGVCGALDRIPGGSIGRFFANVAVTCSCDRARARPRQSLAARLLGQVLDQVRRRDMVRASNAPPLSPSAAATAYERDRRRHARDERRERRR